MKPICVVKVGGALVDSADALPVLASRISILHKDWSVVIIHGGGPQATRLARLLGREPVIVEGRRVTSSLDLEIIVSSVCGAVNTQLVAALTGVGLPAVGTSGAAANMVLVTKRPPWELNGEIVDFGYVGDIDEINPSPILSLLENGYLPVVATVGVDGSGQLYNVNADTTASAVAVAIRAQRFCLVTGSGGLRKAGRIVHYCDDELYRSGWEEGWIKDGMLVKLKAGFAAVRSGVDRVEIVGVDNLIGKGGTELVQSTASVEAP